MSGNGWWGGGYIFIILYLCFRKDYSLEKYISKMEKEGYVIKAKKLLWTDADSIYQRLREKTAK